MYSLISTEELPPRSREEGGTKEGTALPPVIKSIALDTRRDFPDPLSRGESANKIAAPLRMELNTIFNYFHSHSPQPNHVATHLSPVTAIKQGSEPKSTSMSVSSSSLVMPAMLEDLMETIWLDLWYPS